MARIIGALADYGNGAARERSMPLTGGEAASTQRAAA
jgi:hypothetical protein